MQEIRRDTGSADAGEPLVSPISLERQVLQRETAFFRGRKGNKAGYVGLLTASDHSSITIFYPEIARGMLLLYDHLERPTVEDSAAERFLSRYLSQRLMGGELLSNEDVSKIREGIKEGKYSEQFEAYEDYQRRSNRTTTSERVKNEQGPSDLENAIFGGVRGKSKEAVYEDYRPIIEGADAVFDKRQVIARVLGIQTTLQSLYGEVDYRKALVTELLLDAPFIETVALGSQVDAEATSRHEAYLQEIAEFAAVFDPANRFRTFEEQTDKYQTSWTEETPEPDVTDFDKEYLQRMYKFAQAFLDGSGSTEDLYSLLRETVLRRGQLFKASTVERNRQTVVEIQPAEIEAASFDDIAGYEEQKAFYRTLLEKTAAGDPIVNDIGVIISAGKPGVGKSLGVRTFLSNLPENAKGIVIERGTTMTLRGSKLPQHEALIKLANLHPELHLFAIMEDMDTLAGDRHMSPLIGAFLEIDSVIPDAMPANLHIIGTTNKLEEIDSAVTRPGRASKILIYEVPRNASVRKEIARIHAQLKEFVLDDESLELIASKTNDFTPDEVRQIVWDLKFDGIELPTGKDVDKYIDEIKRKHRLEKDQVGFRTGTV